MAVRVQDIKSFDKNRVLCYTLSTVWIRGGCMIEKSNIYEVKKNIEGCVGQKVLLRGSLGRNKSFEKLSARVDVSGFLS